MKEYKFLLFDLDHTLFDFEMAEDIALTQLLQEERVLDIQAYKDYYVPMNKALWQDLEQQRISKADLIKTRFARLFQHFGFKKDGVYLASRYQYYLSQQGQSFSGASHLLDVLTSRGYEIYAVTNGITYIQTKRMAHSDLAPYFNQLFISEQLSTQKPDILFYEKIAEQIPDFDYSKALVIGDSLTADIAGGNNAGIDSVWYNPAELQNQSNALPTYTVKNYQELLDLLP